MLVARTDDGIEFPMTESRAVVGGFGSLGDMSFTGHDASGIEGAIALASLLAGLTELQIEVAVVPLFVPDVPVQGLV